MLAKKYSEIINKLHQYDVNKEIEITREMTFLDACRDKEYIDDVMVYFIKEGNKPEECWVRIVGLKENFLIGILLNEPYQEFGCHKRDKITFFVQETEDGKIICISEMNSEQNM